MDSKSKKLTLFAILAALFATGCATFKKETGSIFIDACVLRGTAESGPTIRTTISNRTKRPIETYMSSLPWGSSSAARFMVFLDTWGFERVEARPYVDDPSPKRVLLQPGETMVGSIELSSRFPRIKHALADAPLGIYMKYEFTDIEETISELMRKTFFITKDALGDVGRCK
ncbi:hypothetical protein QTI33_04295 [Variovorax sp. J22P271]|uniref:hypothetical protein n=1 Tax=Variovorax davisae TaxID=3053515 RepID=UPI002578242A|nr:hypothetical protein [Variovorax sp. J22P271]MDM0031356.1 hypothetical protein [Variovorax sp. J22P271]